MPNISNFLQEGQYLNYTPAAATYAGNVVNLGNMAGFTPSDIAAAALGQAMISGVIRVPATATLGNVGDNVWWDANGTQAITGGTTDGACTTNAVAGDFWLGTLTAALAIADGWAEVAINKVNPNLPAWTGKTHFLTAADLTLVVATHGGGVIHVTKDAGADTKITLPNGVAGMEFIIQNDDADGANNCQVDPTHATEHIEGANLTIANTKIANNTLATSVRGDYLHLRCDVATASWCCLNKRGIWVTD